MRTINCDEVIWVRNILERYVAAMQLATKFPSCSYLRSAAQLAAILEIVETLGFCFLDESAKSNALSGLDFIMCDDPEFTRKS